jgi:hypothetical protein
MHGNDTIIVIVTNEVKAFDGKLGLWVSIVEGKSLEIFSRLKDFVEENSVESVTLELIVYHRSLG